MVHARWFPVDNVGGYVPHGFRGRSGSVNNLVSSSLIILRTTKALGMKPMNVLARASLPEHFRQSDVGHFSKMIIEFRIQYLHHFLFMQLNIPRFLSTMLGHHHPHFRNIACLTAIVWRALLKFLLLCTLSSQEDSPEETGFQKEKKKMESWAHFISANREILAANIDEFHV
jgi:hypothetical protein